MTWSKVDTVLLEAIADGAFPGAVYLVTDRERVLAERALGRQTYAPDAPVVTPDAMYDLASLTKVVVSTTLAMIAYDRGLLDLDAPVTRYLPEFAGGGRERVMVRHLLTHSSGLRAWGALYETCRSKEEILRAICRIEPEAMPGTQAVYSDLGILLLGEILERLWNLEIDVVARREALDPLGMRDTMYRPPASLLARIPPTEVRAIWREGLIHGEVHDENTAAMGGVAPHAGLFGTARDLGVFGRMMLNRGLHEGRRLIAAETVDLFTRRAEGVPGSSRALGWDTRSESGSSAGRRFSLRSYGHTGFTGTTIWIDPERGIGAVLLTNRVHPTRENLKIKEVRPTFHDAVVEAIETKQKFTTEGAEDAEKE
ncbi:MAG: class A beta-lactamase-related serine hydrolase [Candidatus Latescibacteria bacterium]|nr:class A beta-lactamase-related serine hydrolase [Candidatus Latescibacterota bacterium]